MALERFRTTREFHQNTTDHLYASLSRSAFLRSQLPQIECVIQIALHYATPLGGLIQFMTFHRLEEEAFVIIKASVHTQQLKKKIISKEGAEPITTIGLVNPQLSESVEGRNLPASCGEAYKMMELFSEGIGQWVPEPFNVPSLYKTRFTVITKRDGITQSIMSNQIRNKAGLLQCASYGMRANDPNLTPEQVALMEQSFNFMIGISQALMPVNAGEGVDRISIDSFHLQWQKKFHSPRPLSRVLEGIEGKLAESENDSEEV